MPHSPTAVWLLKHTTSLLPFCVLAFFSSPLSLSFSKAFSPRSCKWQVSFVPKTVPMICFNLSSSCRAASGTIQGTGVALGNQRQGLSLESQPKMLNLSINKVISGGDKCNKENKVMGRECISGWERGFLLDSDIGV